MSSVAALLQVFAGFRTLSDLFRSEHAEFELISQSCPRPVPPQPITSGARRKTVLDVRRAALVSLDNVVNLPMANGFTDPAPVLENNRVAAEVAMARSFVVDRTQGGFSHPINDAS